jgi:hypothetical protein
MLGVVNASADEPPRAWRTWTVWPPFLLTLPVFCVYIVALGRDMLAGYLAAAAVNCAGTCVHGPMGRAESAAAGEGVLTITALVLLVTGWQRSARRQPIVAAAWAVCVLAYGVPALLAALGLN